jgi:hypothetical protein
MTLWDLLTGLCVSTAIGGAIAAASQARAGVVGYVLALLSGVIVGVSSACLMRAVGEKVATRVELYSGAKKERYYRALYFAALLWVFLALFLGSWVASPLIGFVR